MSHLIVYRILQYGIKESLYLFAILLVNNASWYGNGTQYAAGSTDKLLIAQGFISLNMILRRLIAKMNLIVMISDIGGNTTSDCITWATNKQPNIHYTKPHTAWLDITAKNTCLYCCRVFRDFRDSKRAFC